MSEEGRIRSVLIVDDEPALLIAFRRMLRKNVPEGTIFITAQNGNEAIKKIKMDAPTVVITDLMMPCGTGFDLLKNCQEEIGNGMVVIVMSGGTVNCKLEPEDALDMGAKAVLKKPVDIAEFRELVLEHIN